MQRGWYQLEEVGEACTFAFRTARGRIAMRLTLDPSLYPPERRARILRFVEKHLVDPVDPPLKLLADEPPRRLLATLDDPYQLGRRE